MISLCYLFSRGLGRFRECRSIRLSAQTGANDAVERIKALSCDKPIEWEEYNEFHARLARHENGIVGEIAQR
jgi:hypothetical protein